MIVKIHLYGLMTINHNMQEEINKLNNRIIELEKLVRVLTDGDNRKTKFADSGIAVFSKGVQEGGGSSYFVAKTYDGMYVDQNNRYIGYYNMP